MLKFAVICCLMTTAYVHGRPSEYSNVSPDSDDGGDHIFSSHHDDTPHPSPDAHAKVISSSYNTGPDGYSYHIKTSNGITNNAHGDAYGKVHGEFEWISPEGKHVELSYVADEHGYQPHSSVIPTPPPIPDEILRSLRYIAAHPTEKEVHEEHVEHDEHGEHK